MSSNSDFLCDDIKNYGSETIISEPSLYIIKNRVLIEFQNLTCLEL